MIIVKAQEDKRHVRIHVYFNTPRNSENFLGTLTLNHSQWEAIREQDKLEIEEIRKEC